jgi:hypothetical protein
MPLPISPEIDALLAAERPLGDALHPIAVWRAAMIRAPRRLLSEADQMGAGEMVVMEAFGSVRAVF